VYSLDFLYILLVSAIVVTVLFISCPYPDPQIFPYSSHSSPHPRGGRGDRAATWFFVVSWGKTTMGEVGGRYFKI